MRAPFGSVALRGRMYLSIWLAVSPTVSLCENVFITKILQPSVCNDHLEHVILRLGDMKPNHSLPDQLYEMFHFMVQCKIDAISRICPKVVMPLMISNLYQHACMHIWTSDI